MGNPSLLSLGLTLLVLFHGCFAFLDQYQQQMTSQFMHGFNQHRLRSKTECNIQRLTAQEPNYRYDYEAGTTELWDQNKDEFRCAGVAAARHVIQPKGLLLPSYTSSPQTYFVVKGRGIQGTVIPGCPETYEESSSQYAGEEEGERATIDRHQRVQEIKEGDVVALPAGVAHWAYNNGPEPLVCVSLIDVGNDANQLDLDYRRFFLAGNPQRAASGQGSRQQEHKGQAGREPKHGQQQNVGNVLNGFDEQMLAEAFNVDLETARSLQSRDDNRGNIVRVERDLHLIIPRSQEEERQSGQGMNMNGLEEAMCTTRLRENIGRPSRADVYNPRGGRISTLNGNDLPILNQIQLSAERGVLYKNAILAPQWNIDAHSIIYFTRGSGRLQVVGNAGECAFDGEVRQAQLVVVPQNFALMMKANQEGLDWIAFKTNGNAMITPIAGRTSALRSMPVEVLMSSYEISREEARTLKYSQQELTVFSPGSSSS